MQGRSTFSVVLASILGAAVGTLIAFKLDVHFWWLGLLIGGLTGYLSYEWKTVLTAIPQAFKATKTLSFPQEVFRVFGWFFLMMTSICVNMFVLFFPIYFLLVAHISFFASSTPTISYLIFALCATLGCGLFFGVMVSIVTIGEKSVQKNRADEMREMFYDIVPHNFLLRIVPAWVIIHVMDVLPRFCHELFIRIHSERRLIAGVSALLGTGVGYFMGTPIAGILSAGLFALFFLKVVSQRWLHLTAR